MNQKQILLKSLEKRGFSKGILEAFLRTKRENFIPLNLKEHAYDDNALPIGYGQTISQPCTIASMLELLDLKKGDSVLEIGSGSGWNAALMGFLVGRKGSVLSTEIIDSLVERSRKRIEKIGKEIKYNH